MSEKKRTIYVHPRHIANHWNDSEDSGMTLRDHFAGLAMQAYLSLPITQDLIADGTQTPTDVCTCAYAFADGMLAARSQGGRDV